jgi:hypothetical protein
LEIKLGGSVRTPEIHLKGMLPGSIFDVRPGLFFKNLSGLGGDTSKFSPPWHIPGKKSIYLRLTMALQKVAGSPPPHTYLSHCMVSGLLHRAPSPPNYVRTLHTPKRWISGVPVGGRWWCRWWVGQCKPVLGLDSDGEVIGAWHNLCIPNMWYMMGHWGWLGSVFSFLVLWFQRDDDDIFICLQSTLCRFHSSHVALRKPILAVYPGFPYPTAAAIPFFLTEMKAFSESDLNNHELYNFS